MAKEQWNGYLSLLEQTVDNLVKSVKISFYEQAKKEIKELEKFIDIMEGLDEESNDGE